MVLGAVYQNGTSILYASKVVYGDKKMILAAIQRNSGVFDLASKDLKSEKEIIRMAVDRSKSWMNVFNRAKFAHVALDKTLGMTKSLSINVFLDGLEKNSPPIQKTFKGLKDLKTIGIDSKETIKSSLLNSGSILLQAGWLNHAVWMHVITDPKDAAK